MADYLQVVTTTGSRDDAARLGRSAVEARLAACAQVVGPNGSTYWWNGTVEDAEEWLVLLKTTADHADALRDHIRERHSYETPEIVTLPIVSGNPAYLSWIAAETRPR